MATIKGATQVALENLNKKKDLYPLTRKLSNDQFDSLKVAEKKLLMIQWSFPGDSLIDVTGGKRAKEKKLLSPPPSIFARHDTYKKNAKSLTQWWNTSLNAQRALVEEYNEMKFDEVLLFQQNIIAMLEEQGYLFEENIGAHSFRKERSL